MDEVKCHRLIRRAQICCRETPKVDLNFTDESILLLQLPLNPRHLGKKTFPSQLEASELSPYPRL